MFVENDFKGSDNEEIFDNLVEKIYELIGDAEISEIKDDKLRTIACILEMHFQVMNGGLLQFVDNDSGKLFNKVKESLNQLYLNDHILLLDKIQSLFPEKNIPTDMSERRDLLDRINENEFQSINEIDLEEFWDEIDDLYYQLQDDFYSKVIAYLKN